MTQEQEPLAPPSAALASLLASEREAPPLAPDALARIRAGVRGATGGGGTGPRGGGGGGSGGLRHLASGLVGVAIGVALTLALQRGPGGDGAAIASPPDPAGPAIAGFAAAPRDPVDRRVAVPEADRAPRLAVAEPAPSAPAAAARAGAPTARRSTTPSTVVITRSTLEDEREILDAARGALVRGHPAQALAASDRHARVHPDGALAEEREVIAAQALAALGRREDARARAAAFHARWPSSLLAAAIDRAAAVESP